MSEPTSWTCPFCNQLTTITDSDIHTSSTNLLIKNKDGPRQLYIRFIVCPNPKCKKTSLEIYFFSMSFNKLQGYWDTEKLLKKWRLIPTSDAKSFPEYVPLGIRNDYLEACLIKDLSPKASATLARRCLQGMIRDFWGVKGNDLNEEVSLIKGSVEPLTWQAIDSTRKIGNIGAHMEKDINLIIEVAPDEADHLINLIEILIKDWYINREERKLQLETIKDLASKKEQQKVNNKK